MRILVAGFNTREEVNAAMDKFIEETGILMITIVCGGLDSTQHNRSIAEEWARDNGASVEYIFDEDSDKVTTAHVRMAKDRIEHNKIIDIIKTLPLQQQRVLVSILNLTKQKEEITSGKLYETYTDLYKKDAVTYRRIFDFINELEMLGIISTNTISRGRGKGRTNIIKLQCDETLLESSLTVI